MKGITVRNFYLGSQGSLEKEFGRRHLFKPIWTIRASAQGCRDDHATIANLRGPDCIVRRPYRIGFHFLLYYPSRFLRPPSAVIFRLRLPGRYL